MKSNRPDSDTEVRKVAASPNKTGPSQEDIDKVLAQIKDASVYQGDGHDNVILSPHVSGLLPSYDEKCSVLFALNLRRYLAGEPMLNLVDRERGY